MHICSMSRVGIGSCFELSNLGSSRVWVIRVRIGSSFGSVDLGSSRISGRSGSDRVSDCSISGHLMFLSRSGSDRVGYQIV
jgi:hypothetical protein